MCDLLLQLFLIAREDARISGQTRIHININTRNTFLDRINRKYIINNRLFGNLCNNHVGLVCQVNVIHNDTQKIIFKQILARLFIYNRNKLLIFVINFAKAWSRICQQNKIGAAILNFIQNSKQTRDIIEYFEFFIVFAYESFDIIVMKLG